MSKQQAINSQHWRVLERIFEAALELPLSERAAYLNHACGADEALRAEVEALLKANDVAPDFLCAPAVSVRAADWAEQLAAVGAQALVAPATMLTAQAGAQVGAYRLLHELGRGGMGVVWLAERADGQFEQRVALKLMHAAWWDKAEQERIQQRFRHERQLLASFNHPHIARLVDGGALPDGRPFFALEYIEGQPVDAYCQTRQLDLCARLRLFLQICSAVQYAHQRLVIHRDLKPTNILVTTEGVPKLLDFGIAKVLQTDVALSSPTLPGVQPMTPAYASPEQVRGETLTTASDVYSLGVVLYELLTARSPYQLTTDSLNELTRAICEQEPVRPSLAKTERQKEEEERESHRVSLSLRLSLSPSQLRGDIDSIVLMALRKEPAARYHSVEQFAEDVERFLQGLPTRARRATFGYRTSKYLRRHRWPLAAGALILLSLLGGLISTRRQAHLALAAQQRAEGEQQQAAWQRRRAETALASAETRRQEAEAARSDAEHQRGTAEQQRQMAEAQTQLAEHQRTRAETQELANRRLLYLSRMGLAQQAWDNANAGRARELLEAYLPPTADAALRNFEWYYLWRLTHGELINLPQAGHPSGLFFSPDGTRVATLLNSGNRPDATLTLTLRDAATWRSLDQLRWPSTGLAMYLSATPDQGLLALGQGSTAIRLVSLWEGRELRTFERLRAPVRSLALASDGRWLAAGFVNGTISILATATGEERQHFQAHAQQVNALAFTPDSQTLLSAGAEPTVKIWEAATGKPLRQLTPTRPAGVPIAFKFFAQGQRLLVNGDGILKVFDWATGKEQASVLDVGRALAIAPDGKTLATGGEDATEQAAITFYDTTTWKPTGNIIKGHGNLITALAFAPDGRRLLSGSADRSVRLWNLDPPATARESTSITGTEKSLVFRQARLTPDGQRLIVARSNQTAIVLDVTSGATRFVLRGHTLPTYAGTAGRFTVAVAADGRTYATGGKDGRVKLWNAETGAETMSFATPNEVSTIAFSPDGRYLAAAYVSQLCIWEIASKRVVSLLKGHNAYINGIVFLPGGEQLLTGSSDGTVKRWEAATGKLLQTFWCSDEGIAVLTLSPHGKWFATGSNDTTARLWEVATGNEVMAFRGHSAWVQAVAFSPDGQRLVTGSMDKTVRLWDVNTGQELLTLRHHQTAIARDGVGFSHDGRLLFSADWWQHVNLWRTITEADVSVANRPLIE